MFGRPDDRPQEHRDRDWLLLAYWKALGEKHMLPLTGECVRSELHMQLKQRFTLLIGLPAPLVLVEFQRENKGFLLRLLPLILKSMAGGQNLLTLGPSDGLAVGR